MKIFGYTLHIPVTSNLFRKTLIMNDKLRKACKKICIFTDLLTIVNLTANFLNNCSVFLYPPGKIFKISITEFL